MTTCPYCSEEPHPMAECPACQNEDNTRQALLDTRAALIEFYEVNCRFGIGGLGMNEYIAANKRAKAVLSTLTGSK